MNHRSRYLNLGLGGLCLVAWIFPVWAWANMDPFLDAKPGWLLFGELVPLVIETSLVRTWFKLSYGAALWIVFLANLASFLLPLSLYVIIGSGCPPSAPYLAELSSTLWPDWPAALIDWPVLAQHLSGWLLFCLVLTTLIETPIYFKMIPRARPEIDRRRLTMIWLLNLISYPVYFGLVTAGALIAVAYRAWRPT